MYSSTGVVDSLILCAEEFVLQNDRMIYSEFFKRAEEFCIDNEVIIGGAVGIDMLIGKSLSKDTFFWELYTDDTFNIAKSLADTLSEVKAPHVDSATIALQTNMRHREFTLMINTRWLFKIYSMDKYRGMKLATIMGPVMRDGYFSSQQVSLIPEEMQLMDIYRTLYTPSKASSWGESIEIESKVYNMIENLATKGIDGGAQFDRVSSDKIILRRILASGPYIVVGDYALAAFDKKTSPNRLQFISSDPIDSLAQNISKALTLERDSLRRVSVTHDKVTYVRYNLNIPSDFQLTKYTIYANVKGSQVAIADVFNSTEYEMVPFSNVEYNQVKYKIGNPWVLLRFQFIDIWILKLIINLGKVKNTNDDFLIKRVKSLVNSTSRVRAYALSMLDTDSTKLFQLDNYLGDNTSDIVAKKKLIKERGERFATYFPAISGGYDPEKYADPEE
jgi:hypothetical protein